MLNFKLKSNAIDPNSDKPLVAYLQSLGIEDTDEFIIRPSIKNEISGEHLENAMHTVLNLNKLFKENKKFFLIVDCDTDGYTSSAIFYNYFKSIFPNADIQYMLHEGKQHGIELDKIPDDREVIIVPDAGSNQIEELTILNAQKKYVFVIDHHQVECKIPNLEFVTVVNNQTSNEFTNKALSGAGVVFKIIQLYDTVFFTEKSRSSKFYDLAALGIIADFMDSKTLDNNYIIHRVLNNINNLMFKALIDKQSYSIGSDMPTKMDVAFYIAPLINGTIRMGTIEEKELLFRGFIEQNHTEYYDHTWRGQITIEDFYHRAARIAFNVKNEQNRLKMKCLEFLKQRVNELHLDQNKIIVVITKDNDEVPVPKTITGLVAMELLKLYGKPSLVLRPVEVNGQITYAGSGRSNSYEELPSFLDFVREQEESVYAQGHACAFGASIKASELDHFIQSCNDKMSHIDFSNDTIYVDAIFKDRINHYLIADFARGKHIYGNQIPEPLIAIQTTISASNIMFMGADQKSVRITIGGVPCIKFKDDKLVQQLKGITRAKVTIIGRPNLNNFKGIESAQIMISNIDIEPLSSGGLF